MIIDSSGDGNGFGWGNGQGFTENHTYGFDGGTTYSCGDGDGGGDRFGNGYENYSDSSGNQEGKGGTYANCLIYTPLDIFLAQ